MKNKSTKNTDVIRNWREYTNSLCKRGSITVWINEDAINHWYSEALSGSRGASFLYSDLAIECLLVLKSVYGLGLRQVTGFASSLFALMGLPLEIPHYSTLSRRQGGIDVELSFASGSMPAHIVIDSTGLKVYGEGEWHVRQHGASKRRQWRKLHLSVDTKTLQIRSAVVTENDVADNEIFSELLSQIEAEVDQVSADGAYDTWDIYQELSTRNARGAIPPRRGARIKQHGNSLKPPLERDEHIRMIRKVGRSEWKRRVGYHQRSLAETTMYRYKQIFGDHLRSRSRCNQVSEVMVKCSILNRMSALGMPER